MFDPIQSSLIINPTALTKLKNDRKEKDEAATRVERRVEHFRCSKGRTTLDVGADGVGIITIINPPVNSLSFDVLYSLKDTCEQALRRDDVKAIVITGAQGKFSGGFDISAFGKIQDKTIQAPKPGFVSFEILGDIVAAANKPFVAAIDGLALGGGLEVAMACHARISTPNAQLGLPELQLGIIPGFGGTQALPRLVGIAKALEMMLTSKPVKGEEALSLGLVDALASSDEVVNTARRWALDILERKRPWVISYYKTDKLEPLGEAREMLKFARAQTRKRAPNLRHPLVCIDVVEEGIVSGARTGLWKVPGVTDLGLKPRSIKKVAILGGGLMGSGIATALVLSNYSVILKEVNDKFLQAGIGRVKANLQSRVKKGQMSQEKFEKTLSLLKGALDYESFRDVDMVIESGSCDAAFRNCSHSEDASQQVIIDLLDVGKKIKKTPVVVGNCTGFAVNRMFFPYTQAALLLVERGTDVYQIDRAITKFGMPMGPFRLCDLVGFGVAIATGGQFVLNFPERTYKSMVIPLMQEDKRAGETTPRLAKLSDKDIVEMIFFPVVNEACRVLAEGIAVKAADLDVSAVMGMGFPPYRGGIMFWADSLGSKYICSRLEEWSNSYGGFFKPCSYLAERAAKGAPLSLTVDPGKSRLVLDEEIGALLFLKSLP
ncbi:hypothetical protein DH2020_043644 [Rehmannia glutinosa]|uniref:3-hydroxyacyl-CoA dehydrogenase n=1 Tax=Rehmannia glutinosa TaxID=99300 RepID=A0ABR0UJ22_REHGL